MAVRAYWKGSIARSDLSAVAQRATASAVARRAKAEGGSDEAIHAFPIQFSNSQSQAVLRPSLRAKRSNPWSPQKESIDCFAALAMTANRKSKHTRPRGAMRPRLCCIFRPKRAWGTPDALGTRGLVCTW
jgi:hypothetical protein